MKAEKITLLLVIIIMTFTIALSLAHMLYERQPDTDLYISVAVQCGHPNEPIIYASYDLVDYYDVKISLLYLPTKEEIVEFLTGEHIMLAAMDIDSFLSVVDTYGDRFKYYASWDHEGGLKGVTARDSAYSFNGSSLKGARIGADVSSQPYIYLLKYLNDTGQDDFIVHDDASAYDKDRVNIYPTKDAELTDVLKKGNVDIIVTDHHAIDITVADPAYRYIRAEDGLKTETAYGLVANCEQIGQYTKMMKGLVAAIDDAIYHMHIDETRDVTIDQLTDTFGKDRKVVAAYVTDTDWKISMSDRDKKAIRTVFEYIVRYDPERFKGYLKDVTEFDADRYTDNTWFG